MLRLFTILYRYTTSVCVQCDKISLQFMIGIIIYLLVYIGLILFDVGFCDSLFLY